MTIINPLPYTIANGDPVDATPVQANLNQIVSNVNANAAAVAGNASQEFLVATTTNPAGAVPLAQAQTQFAAISGSSANTFAVASGTGSDAVPYTQMQAYVGSTSAPLSGSAGQTFAVAPAPAGSTDAPQISQTLGAGATAYTDQTSNRAVGTNYTNTNSRPLYVAVSLNVTAPAGENNITITVGGFYYYDGIYNASSTSTTLPKMLNFIVPPGSTYKIDYAPGATVNFWFEY